MNRAESFRSILSCDRNFLLHDKIWHIKVLLNATNISNSTEETPETTDMCRRKHRIGSVYISSFGIFCHKYNNKRRRYNYV